MLGAACMEPAAKKSIGIGGKNIETSGTKKGVQVPDLAPVPATAYLRHIRMLRLVRCVNGGLRRRRNAVCLDRSAGGGARRLLRRHLGCGFGCWLRIRADGRCLGHDPVCLRRSGVAVGVTQ